MQKSTNKVYHNTRLSSLPSLLSFLLFEVLSDAVKVGRCVFRFKLLTSRSKVFHKVFNFLPALLQQLGYELMVFLVCHPAFTSNLKDFSRIP